MLQSELYQIAQSQSEYQVMEAIDSLEDWGVLDPDMELTTELFQRIAQFPGTKSFLVECGLIEGENSSRNSILERNATLIEVSNSYS